MNLARHILFSLTLATLSLLSLTARAEHQVDEIVDVNIFSAYSTPQERELIYSFKQTLLEQYKIQANEKLIFWERQEDWKTHLESNQPSIIVAIGNDSFNKIRDLDLQTPIIALMLNRRKFENLKALPRDNIYAITHSQPPKRFVEVAKSLNVYQAQIGSFISPQTKQNIAMFNKLANFYNLSYRPVMVEPKLNGRDALSQLSTCCSVIILESDCVFRPGKVRKSILVNAYRERIIVIAHSESVLKEGAMLTLSSQPNKIGNQAADLYKSILDGTVQQPYQDPKSFTISINRKIARLLGYKELTVGELMQKVDTLEFIHNNMANGATVNETMETP